MYVLSFTSVPSLFRSSLGVNDDAVRRFISLMDECYDHQVLLLLNAEVPLDCLYLNGSLLFEFRRTYSRLIEMKSHYYQTLRTSFIDSVRFE